MFITAFQLLFLLLKTEINQRSFNTYFKPMYRRRGTFLQIAGLFYFIFMYQLFSRPCVVSQSIRVAEMHMGELIVDYNFNTVYFF